MTRRQFISMLYAVLGTSLLTLSLNACSRRARGSSALAVTIGTEGDTLAFNHDEIRAPVGQPIMLTFRNNSRTMQHNWVLVNGDRAAAEQVSEASLAAGAKQEYLPTDNSLLIAHTRLLSVGQQETIHFTTPERPGSYVYLCTFPGHYQVGMWGEFVVES